MVEIRRHVVSNRCHTRNRVSSFFFTCYKTEPSSRLTFIEYYKLYNDIHISDPDLTKCGLDCVPCGLARPRGRGPVLTRETLRGGYYTCVLEICVVTRNKGCLNRINTYFIICVHNDEANRSERREKFILHLNRRVYKPSGI